MKTACNKTPAARALRSGITKNPTAERNCITLFAPFHGLYITPVIIIARLIPLKKSRAKRAAVACTQARGCRCQWRTTTINPKNQTK